MNTQELSNFVIGCIGALAPECIRLYKLRFNPNFRWSWGYLLLSIPFVLLGGFVAWILEPTSKYAAFYAGVSTPVIVTTIARDSEEVQKEKQQLKLKNQDLERRLGEAEVEIQQKALDQAKLLEEKVERQQKLEDLPPPGQGIPDATIAQVPSRPLRNSRRPAGLRLKNFWNAL